MLLPIGGKEIRKFILFAGVGIFLPLVFSASSGWGAGETGGSGKKVLEKKTLARADDFIVLRGEKLKKSLNEKISNLSLFASVRGEMKPIPFQIDEINPEGEWVLPNIPPEMKNSGIETDQDDDGGCLDKNDEFVFMVRDAGERVGREFYPPGAKKVEEIELVDSAGGGKAWVYLCSFPGSAPRSDSDYVDYRFPPGRVKSRDYEVGFSPEMAISPDYVSLWGSEDIIDRMKIRVQIRTIGIKFSVTESNFHSQLSLYKDGPIRVIRRVRSQIRLSKIIRTKSAAVENIYYDNAMLIPIRVDIPVSPRILKKMQVIDDISAMGGVDFTNLHGWTLRAESDPRWLKIDGKMDETEKCFCKEGATWFIVRGLNGALLYRIVLDRRPDGSYYQQPMETDFLYVDDDKTPDPPENVPGQSPMVGFLINKVEDISKGLLYIYAIMYIMPDYREGDERKYLNILDQPIKISVN